MKATVKETKPWQRSIYVEIPDEEVQEEFQTQLNKYRKEVRLPGFRQGKVPVNMIKSRFGNVIREEIINNLIKKSVSDACQDNRLIPLTEFKLEDLKVEDNRPVTFNVEFEVDPVIEIKDYKDLKIKIEKKKISNKDIDDALKELLNRMAKYEDVDRMSQEGDYITIDTLDVTVDGKPKNELRPPSQPIEIGKGSIKEFDKGLIGLSVGEETEILVTFPCDFYLKDCASKEGKFRIKVKHIREKVIPDINEEFLKNVGNFPDEKSLRDQIKKDLETNARQQAKKNGQKKAIEILIEKNNFDVPPSKIEKYIDRIIEDQAKSNKDRNNPVLDRQQISEIYKDIGIFTMKRYRIIDYIAKKEKIKATQAEVDNRIKLIADQYKSSFEEVKKILRQNGTTTRIREEIKEEKTLGCLIGEIPWEDE
ncbi:MAG: trigger factor [Chitinispirillia bacterium]